MLQTFWGDTTGVGVGAVNEVGESPDDPEGTTVSVLDAPPEVRGASGAGDEDGEDASVGNASGASGINVRSDVGRDASIISGGRAF